MATAALGAGISLASLLGGIFGGRAQTTTSTTNGSSTVNPVYDNQMLDMRNSLLKKYLDLYNQDTDMSGYQAQGLQDINSSSRASENNIMASLAARGLNTSPIAASAITDIGNSRVAQQNAFNNNIPLLKQQLQQQKLQNLSGFFSGLPVGQSSTQNQTETQKGSANMAGSGISSLGTTLAYMAGNGFFNKGGKG